jgi:ferredoxin
MATMEQLFAKFDALEQAFLPPGMIIYIDPEKCIQCGLCAEVCPFGLPQKTETGKYAVLEQKRCVECSACSRNCPTHAILIETRHGCGCLWNVVNDRSKKKKNNCN